MKRTHILLAVLAAILLVAVFWLLMWQPKQEAIASSRVELQATQEQQQLLQAELVRLRSVREAAPEAEALLAAAGAVVPDRSELPSLLRQLQTAADEAGLSMTSVNVGRPAENQLGGALTTSLPVNVAVEGGYFQIVDFLRRVEAPAITPRGVLWDSGTLTPGDYPVITAALIGRTFAASVLAPAEVAEEPTDDEVSEGQTEGDEVDVDVTVEVDQ